MSVDDEEEDEEMAPQQAPRTARESMLGNVLECVFTYGSGFFIYLPVHIWLLFYAELSRPEILWPSWILLTLAYWGVNAYAAVVNTQARFTTKTFRFFADFLSSVSPLILIPFILVFMVQGRYELTLERALLAIFMSGVSLLDLLSHSNLVQTAVRRIREVTSEPK